MCTSSKPIGTILVLLAVCLFGQLAQAKYSGGTGEPNDPYQIATAADLIALGEDPNDYDKHFIVTADIDLDPNLPGRKVFDKAVIASDDPAIRFFTGVFDGRAHTISNLTINGRWRLGLFGQLGPGAKVKDLGLEHASITGSGGYIGGLGANNDGSVINCHSSATVTCPGNYAFYVGGLLGENWGTVKNCYSAGQVRGAASVGALVGKNWGTLDHCSSSGPVTAEGDVGGLAGRNSGTVIHCSSTGAVDGKKNIGGLVGWNDGIVAHCYASGIVSGHTCVGGLVGECVSSPYPPADVTNCYASGMVVGDHLVGGLVGSNEGIVRNSCAIGEVTGEYYVGGLLGHNGGSLSYCLSTGRVSGTGDYGDQRDGIGGLVGHNDDTVTQCFWDTYTSGQGVSDGGAGLNTTEMKDIQTYLGAGWDFVGEFTNGTHDFWQVPEGGGYPFLSTFSGYNPPQLKGEGTLDAPYLISTTTDLGAIVRCNPECCYRLTADIDLSGISWTMPIIPWFSGTFDGDSLSIRNLTSRSVDQYVGLFGRIMTSDAQVKNLAVLDVNVVGLGEDVGGLAGLSWGGVSNCHSTGAVSGTQDNVGGLVGASGGTLLNCYSKCIVTGNGKVGGLAGVARTVKDCYSTGTVRGEWSVGGLVAETGGSIRSCWSTTIVQGSATIGGLVAVNDGMIRACYSGGAVIGEQTVGGLVGINYSSVTDSYSAAIVRGEGEHLHLVGGLVGSNPGRAENSFWDTETSGQATSDGGTGKTTAEMQTAATFLDAGWDFVGEMANGTQDLWILEGKGYPRLWWEAAGP